MRKPLSVGDITDAHHCCVWVDLCVADKYQYTPWLDQPELIPKDPKYFMVCICVCI